MHTRISHVSLLALPLALLLGCDSHEGDQPEKLKHIDRSQAYLADVGTDKPLDYADPNLWMCRPDIDVNECVRDMDATLMLPSGKQVFAPHVEAKHTAFDCFYVYPTVLLTRSGNQTDFSDSATGARIVLDPLRSQAAPFTRVCSVYAPLYRQSGMGASATGGTPSAASMAATAALAFQDVKAAFDYYLKNDNKGRPFVLIGHSQGSGMLTSLVKAKIDEDPALRSQMISALIIGSSITVAKGQRTGGSFKNVPTCSSSKDTGCVVSYMSFAQEAPPKAGGAFTRSIPAGLELACTDPAALTGNKGNYLASYIATKTVLAANFTNDLGGTMPADAKTPFLIYPDMFKGQCKTTADGINYLEIALAKAADDVREPPPYRSSTVESIGGGMHLMDYNLEIEDLLELVTEQARALHAAKRAEEKADKE